LRRIRWLRERREFNTLDRDFRRGNASGAQTFYYFSKGSYGANHSAQSSSRRPCAGARRHLGRAGDELHLVLAHATKVEVCLFDSKGDTEAERLALAEYTDEI
jgi:hypothetical protein